MKPGHAIYWFKHTARRLRREAELYERLASDLEHALDDEEQMIGLILAAKALEEEKKE